MPQLQINQGPQDALLYDNTKSYFTNVGYVRSSNFQVEYRDVDSQNAAAFGSTVQYVIPKAADLLGPVDLTVELNEPADAVESTFFKNPNKLAQTDRLFAQWVDELGFAMIERVTFSVGSNDIETITGDQMQIRNELMTGDENRLAFPHIMKTGRRAFKKVNPGGTNALDLTSAQWSGVGINERPGDNRLSGEIGSGGYHTIAKMTGSDKSDRLVGFRKPIDHDYTRLITYVAGGDEACMEYLAGNINDVGANNTTKTVVGGSTAGITITATTAAKLSLGDAVYVKQDYQYGGKGTSTATGWTSGSATWTGAGTYGATGQGIHGPQVFPTARVLYVFETPNAAGGTLKLCATPPVSGVTQMLTIPTVEYVELYKVGKKALRSTKRQLIIPLSLFFTRHVSQYFPLASVAGCNDIRIAIKFRQLNELIQLHRQLAPESLAAGVGIGAITNLWGSGTAMEGGAAKLRCHYVHVTGPEATTLMNKEHVRLLKLWQHQHRVITLSQPTIDLDLSFLHPVTTLIVTIRRNEDMNSSTDPSSPDTAQKGYFFYHGDGDNPNYDRALAHDGQTMQGASKATVDLDSIQLTLNGQERHPGLSTGISRNYLMNRLAPMLHSNSSQKERQFAASAMSSHFSPGDFGMGKDNEVTDEQIVKELQGAKNIFVFPFSLNPEGSNPAGAVNFSKVSHAKLKLNLDPTALAATSHQLSSSALATDAMNAGGGQYRIDCYALYYNWLQIKDGRAILSFA